MEKGTKTRRRIITLLQMLEAQTDESHALSTPTIIEQMEARGIISERKSLYEDFAALQEAGIAVQYRNSAGWYLAERSFSSAQLRLLVDTVLASRALTDEASRDLAARLAALGSVHQAEQLTQSVTVPGRVKSINRHLYDNIDSIQKALHERKTLGFRYVQYDEQKKKRLRRDGARYFVSPCALVFSHENYYLVAEDHLYNELRHYRVDKMQELACMNLTARALPDGFDAAAYAEQHFEMFGGKMAQMSLRAEKRLVGVLLDRFGMQAELTADGEEHVMLQTEVAISEQLFGWLFGVGDAVELRAPYWAVQEYQSRRRAVLTKHSGFS